MRHYLKLTRSLLSVSYRVFIVMDFVEHDLKSLLALMPTPFLQSEIKTIFRQLLSAVAHCHGNWVLHRDLKTSNLLMNNRGSIKVADFGLARTFGDPLGDMTQLVVTLWYRCVCVHSMPTGLLTFASLEHLKSSSAKKRTLPLWICGLWDAYLGSCC
jgi:serine/threonine protein kinase